MCRYRKLGIVLPKDPTIVLLDMYLKDALIFYKDTCSIMFIAALFVIARKLKQPCLRVLVQ